MIPDYAEALTGYRCWNVFTNGLMVGQSYAEPWPMYQPFVGRCGFTKSQHHVVNGHWVPAPVWHCGCGVHALKDLAVAEQRLIEEMAAMSGGWYSQYVYDYHPPIGRVWGSVKLWGRIIEHDIGYRAEYAYPGELHCQDAALAAVVGHLYGVPCTVKTLDIPAFVRPQPLPSMSQWYTTTAASNANGLYWGSAVTLTTTAPPPVKQPGLIQSPSLLAIKTLGATDWQKQQATPPPAPDWQAVMKKAFHVKKKDSADA